MEVSVIGSTQVKIGRTNYVGLCSFNKNLNAMIWKTKNINSKVWNFGERQSFVLPSKSALGLRLRASTNQAAVISEKSSKVTEPKSVLVLNLRRTSLLQSCHYLVCGAQLYKMMKMRILKMVLILTLMMQPWALMMQLWILMIHPWVWTLDKLWMALTFRWRVRLGSIMIVHLMRPKVLLMICLLIIEFIFNVIHLLLVLSIYPVLPHPLVLMIMIFPKLNLVIFQARRWRTTEMGKLRKLEILFVLSSPTNNEVASLCRIDKDLFFIRL